MTAKARVRPVVGINTARGAVGHPALLATAPKADGDRLITTVTMGVFYLLGFSLRHISL